MQTSLENLGPLERRLNIAVPQGQIEAEIENRLKRLTHTVKLHGFRPGKVPYKIVAQHYGEQVRQEVLGDTLQKSFTETVKAQNLKVAGYPRFEAKSLGENAAQFEYSATFEVYPEVVLGDLTQVSIERPDTPVGDADIDKTIEILRKQRVRYEPAERPAANGDQLVINYRGKIDGAEFDGGKADNFTLVLGEGRMLAGFETPLAGMKAGETKRFELTFPEDYHGKEAAGKTAMFEVEVTRVAGPELPAVDAEFAKSLGIEDGDLGKMRAEIKANLEREVKRRIQAKVKEKVMAAVIDTSKLDLPKALVEMEIQRLMHGARRDLESRGIKMTDGTLPRNLFDEQANRRVTLGLILAELVKVHGLEAKPEQVRAMVEDFAQSYEHSAEVVKWYYAAPERLNEAEALALEENVVRWVLGQAEVVDKPTPFDELMGKA